MTFRLYDSAQRAVVEFQPLEPGKVSIYSCGPTVQGAPHLGHVRMSVNFDVLRRWLEHSGYEVTFVTNVTDIDDKILAKSAEAGRPWWAHAYLYEKAFHDAFAALGVRRPTYEPRATGHVPEMIELMRELIDAGHAYDAGGGNVYFDVKSWPAYGELSGMKVDQMESEDAQATGKRDPRDFALWKAGKPGEPETASWDTPWGRGRPGWHLECSAMSGRYLGPAFDIHGGGLDLRFPHHENELAQSRAAGRPFASYWMHNAWVTMAGEKMSKSLGNTADVLAATARYGGRAVRLYLAGPHYRSAIELSDESLSDAAAQLARIDSFLSRGEEFLTANPPADIPAGAGTEAWASFASAMDDDLGTPGAVAALFQVVRHGNQALASGDAAEVAVAMMDVLQMLGVLGLNPKAPEWQAEAGASDDLAPVVDRLVQTLLDQRAEARARKDWATADALRDSLAASGLKIEDTKDGARWSLAKEN